jgi:hypothetical protein
LRKRVRRLAPIPVALVLSLSLFAAVSQATVNLSGLVAAPAPANQGGTTQAGAASTFHLHANLSSFPGSDDLRNLTFHLPPGLVGNPNAAARCTGPQFFADGCPAGSRVGVASNSLEIATENAEIGDVNVTINGDVYNLFPVAGQAGLLGIVLRPQPLTFSDITVGTVNFASADPTTPCVPPQLIGGVPTCFFVRADITSTSPKQFQPVPVTIRPGDLGLDNTLANLPREVHVTQFVDITRLCLSPPGTACANAVDVSDNPNFPSREVEDTLDIKLRSIDTLLFARAPSGEPFITNPTSCGPAITVFDALSYQGALTTGSAGFTPTGCNLLPFSPNVAITVSGGSLAAGRHPAVTAVVTQNAGEANQKRASVTLPPGLGPDEALLAQACPEANLQAFTCPASSHIGTATLTSRLFPAPLSAPIYIVQSTPLPGLAVDLRGAGIPAILRATNELTSDSRLRNVFGPLPDLPLSRFALAFNGGAGGALVTNERLCRGNRQFNASFTAQSGAQHSLQGAAQLNGHCPPRARPKCDGVRATIIGNGRANRLFGTGRRDVIVSKGGSDTIRSKGGNDIVCAGAGNDKVFLGKGKDKAFGGKGKDTLRGGPGRDLLNGGGGNDTCVGGAGRDRERSC